MRSYNNKLNYDLMAANFLMNSTASLLNKRTNRLEEDRRMREANLDSFIETPFYRYNYESYSTTPYMKDGGMIPRMRNKKEGIFTQDLYQEKNYIQRKHKPNVGLNDVMGITPEQTKYAYKNGGLYTRGKEAYIDGGRITMRGIDSPVMAFPNGDDPTLMMPGKEYNFPNSTGVREYKMQDGGEVDFWNNVDGEEEVYDATSPRKKTSRPQIPQMSQAPQMTRPITSFKRTKGKRSSKGSEIKQGLLQRGFSNEEAAAIIGNIYAESAFNPGAVNPTSKAFGLMQWLGGRKNKLFSKYGDNPSLDNQLDFIAWELKGGDKYETKMFNKAMKGRTTEERAYNFGRYVERPSAQELADSRDKRENYARLYE